MKSLVFHSVEEAVRDTVNHKELGYVLHVPIDKIEELGRGVSDNVILVSTSGEYTDSGFKNGVISGFSYDIKLSQAVEIMDPPILSKSDLETAYKKVKSNKNAFMMLFLDGMSGAEESVMTSLFFVDDNFKIFGGSAGDDLKFKETIIYMGNKRVKHLALFFDMKSKTQIIKENIYTPVGDKLLITEADPIKRVVYKINNRPATSEYARVLNISESELPNYFMNHPLGKIYQDDILIASPQQVNGDKSITFYCQIMPNTFVHMLEPVNPQNKVADTINQLEFRPSFMYVLNCILRSLKFQDEKLWKPIDACLLGACKNTTGFISYGEQYYKHHVNQTMLILAVE